MQNTTEFQLYTGALEVVQLTAPSAKRFALQTPRNPKTRFWTRSHQKSTWHLDGGRACKFGAVTYIHNM